jgi:hypothetical protein
VGIAAQQWMQHGAAIRRLQARGVTFLRGGAQRDGRMDEDADVTMAKEITLAWINRIPPRHRMNGSDDFPIRCSTLQPGSLT